MPETATEKLPDNPTQEQVRDAATLDGVATFRSDTDPADSPIVAHREAHAEGGEYGPKKKASAPVKKATASKGTSKKATAPATASRNR